MIDVWRINLDTAAVLPPTHGEAARAARFATEELAQRYLASHAALRAILRRFTDMPLEFALWEKGKPYLPLSPELRFNLSRSNDRALIAVARDIDVGVDIEYIRPLANYAAVADRFFPPDAERPADERDFFCQWTRVEALLKAQGVGLYGAGVRIDGDWMVTAIDAGPGFAGAVAASGSDHQVQIHDFGADE